MTNDADHIVQLQQDLAKCLRMADNMGAHMVAIKIAEAQDALKALKSIRAQDSKLEITAFDCLKSANRVDDKFQR